MDARFDRARSAALAVYRAALEGVRAERVLGEIAWHGLLTRRLHDYERVVVCAIGKAAMPYMHTMLERLEIERRTVDDAICVVPHGYPATLPESYRLSERVKVIEAGHPTPDSGSVRAARSVLDVARALNEDDLFICLLSGGGSALCTDFHPPISLDDAVETYRLLLSSGAGIGEMNVVRKRLSRVGGGRLAVTAYPAEIVTLAVSDVPGDDPSVIASGPTVPDATTAEDALRILEGYGLIGQLPASVRAFLQELARRSERDRPLPDAEVFARSSFRLLAGNRTALEAAAACARRMGYVVHMRAEPVTGEAGEIGPRLVTDSLQERASAPACILAGGEATVTLRGSGRGGRCQESALAAGIALERMGAEDVVYLSAGTDGVDGNSPAAGAVVAASQIRRQSQAGRDPGSYLERNDSYTFFEHTEMLVQTGPTHTNVMDVHVILRGIPPIPN